MHQEISPATAIVEREILIAELVNSCKQSVKVGKLPVVKQRQNKVSNETARSHLSIDSLTSNIVDELVRENTAKPTGKNKKKKHITGQLPETTSVTKKVKRSKEPNSSGSSSCNQVTSKLISHRLEENTTGSIGKSKKNFSSDQSLEFSAYDSQKSNSCKLNEQSLSDSFSSDQINNTAESYHPKNNEVQSTGKSNTQSSFDQSLEIFSPTGKPTSTKSKKPNLSLLSCSSQMSVVSRTPRVILTRIDACRLTSSSTTSTPAVRKTRKDKKSESSKSSEVAASSTLDRDELLVDPKILSKTSFSEFSCDLNESRPISSPTTIPQKKRTLQSDIDRRNLELVDQLLLRASRLNKAPVQENKLKRQASTSRSLIEQQKIDLVDRLLHSKKVPVQSAHSETSAIDERNKNLVEQLYHQLQAKEQPTELVPEYHTSTTNSLNKVESRAPKSYKVTGTRSTSQDQIDEWSMEKSTDFKSKRVETTSSKSSTSKTLKLPFQEKLIKQLTEEKKRKTTSSKKVKRLVSKSFTFSSTIDQQNMELVDKLLSAQSNCQPVVQNSPRSKPSCSDTKQKRNASKARLSGVCDELPVKLRKVESMRVESEVESANEVNESLIDLLSDYVKHLPDD